MLIIMAASIPPIEYHLIFTPSLYSFQIPIVIAIIITIDAKDFSIIPVIDIVFGDVLSSSKK
jgi:ABC-type enterochelin transport system permease subunit